jgi:hypothetical protein
MHALASLRRSCEACERAGRIAAEIRDADRCPVCGGPLERTAEDGPERLIARLRAWRHQLDRVPPAELLTEAFATIAATVPGWSAEAMCGDVADPLAERP